MQKSVNGSLVRTQARPTEKELTQSLPVANPANGIGSASRSNPGGVYFHDDGEYVTLKIPRKHLENSNCACPLCFVISMEARR